MMRVRAKRGLDRGSKPRQMPPSKSVASGLARRGVTAKPASREGSSLVRTAARSAGVQTACLSWPGLWGESGLCRESSLWPRQHVGRALSPGKPKWKSERTAGSESSGRSRPRGRMNGPPTLAERMPQADPSGALVTAGATGQGFLWVRPLEVGSSGPRV